MPTGKDSSSSADPSSPWCKWRVAPRRARRRDGKARQPRIPNVFEGGATPPARMHRPANAAPLAPRAARLPTVRILKIEPHAPDSTILSEAATIIAGGGIVAYPTDTLYGLAVDPRNDAAVER